MKNQPDIDTFQLRCFLAVAETQSFTRAAERVGRTQSAVSQQIKKLEEMTGVHLFNRQTREAMITVEGETLLGYARQMLDVKQAMFSQLHASDISGEIRFGTPEDFASIYLPDVLAAFADAYPNARLNVECDLTVNLQTRFAQGAYDIILIKQLRSDAEPHGVTMWTEHLEWVAAPHFRASLLDTKAPIPLVLSPAPCVYRKRAIEALETAGVPWWVTYTSPSFAGTGAAVHAGLGITVLPKKMIPAGLVPLAHRRLRNLRTMKFVLLSRPQLSKAGQAFAEFITTRVR
ncbi:MAG: LysR family transcriptional regulator [Rickettsiales bacterium]|nr:LysR family transcriptional regulator [Rickettsiales bacterium]